MSILRKVKIMEKKYQSLTFFEFQQLFLDDNAYHRHLAQLKWSDGFVCEKCEHTHYCKGKRTHTRQCAICGYQATPTNNTLFHILKFSTLKAFYTVYFITTNKQGLSSTELIRKLSLEQKTCLHFQRKIMKAMDSSQQFLLMDQVEVGEMVAGQQEEDIKGRQNEDKKLAVVAIARAGKAISCRYARLINNASNESLRPFVKNHIDSNATVKMDKWSQYSPLQKEKPQVKSGKKRNDFPDMHRAITIYKVCLRDTYRSVAQLQAYLNEYCYRFNRQLMKGNILDNLTGRMVTNNSVYRKNIGIH